MEIQTFCANSIYFPHVLPFCAAFSQVELQSLPTERSLAKSIDMKSTCAQNCQQRQNYGTTDCCLFSLSRYWFLIWKKKKNGCCSVYLGQMHCWCLPSLFQNNSGKDEQVLCLCWLPFGFSAAHISRLWLKFWSNARQGKLASLFISSWKPPKSLQHLMPVFVKGSGHSWIDSNKTFCFIFFLALISIFFTILYQIKTSQSELQRTINKLHHWLWVTHTYTLSRTDAPHHLWLQNE